MAKRGLSLQAEQLERVKTYVSGSLIGTSKFLHFIRPDLYPIWDRRVAEAMYGLRHYQQFQKVENYLQYMSDLPALKLPAVLQAEVVAKLGAVSLLRQQEFAIFNLHVLESQKPPKGA